MRGSGGHRRRRRRVHPAPCSCARRHTLRRVEGAAGMLRLHTTMVRSWRLGAGRAGARRAHPALVVNTRAGGAKNEVAQRQVGRIVRSSRRDCSERTEQPSRSRSQRVAEHTRARRRDRGGGHRRPVVKPTAAVGGISSRSSRHADVASRRGVSGLADASRVLVPAIVSIGGAGDGQPPPLRTKKRTDAMASGRAPRRWPDGRGPNGRRSALRERAAERRGHRREVRPFRDRRSGRCPASRPRARACRGAESSTLCTPRHHPCRSRHAPRCTACPTAPAVPVPPQEPCASVARRVVVRQ